MTTREKLRARIDLLECLEGVTVAIDDMEGDDSATYAVRIVDGKYGGLSVSHLNGLPPALVLVGLYAMKAFLEAALKPLEVA
jgi:hypothetical protein